MTVWAVWIAARTQMYLLTYLLEEEEEQSGEYSNSQTFSRLAAA